MNITQEEIDNLKDELAVLEAYYQSGDSMMLHQQTTIDNMLSLLSRRKQTDEDRYPKASNPDNLEG